MTGSIRIGAVDIDHDLDAVLLTEAQRIVEDLLAVHIDQLGIGRLVEIRLRIYAVFPVVNKFSRDRDTKEIETMIGDGF